MFSFATLIKLCSDKGIFRSRQVVACFNVIYVYTSISFLHFYCLRNCFVFHIFFAVLNFADRAYMMTSFNVTAFPI